MIPAYRDIVCSKPVGKSSVSAFFQPLLITTNHSETTSRMTNHIHTATNWTQDDHKTATWRPLDDHQTTTRSTTRLSQDLISSVYHKISSRVSITSSLILCLLDIHSPHRASSECDSMRFKCDFNAIHANFCKTELDWIDPRAALSVGNHCRTGKGLYSDISVSRCFTFLLITILHTADS